MSVLSVVIPALNETGNIGRLVTETFAAVPATLLAEVIVVDDASTDGTAEEVAALMPEFPTLRLLRHTTRAGQSSALRTGIRAASSAIVATMDGDGQNDPHDIPQLAGLLERSGPDTALIGGIRTNRKDTGSKRFASRFANWLRDAILDDGCPDTGCGMKVFRRDAFLDLPFFSGLHRYLPAMFQTYGHKVDYLPVNDRARLAGQSKYTNFGRALIGIGDLFGVSWIRQRTRLPAATDVITSAGQATSSGAVGRANTNT